MSITCISICFCELSCNDGAIFNGGVGSCLSDWSIVGARDGDGYRGLTGGSIVVFDLVNKGDVTRFADG